MRISWYTREGGVSFGISLMNNTIYLLVDNDDALREVLYKALVRSFTSDQIVVLDPHAAIPHSASFYVVAEMPTFNPDILVGEAKVLFLGSPNKSTQRIFNMHTGSWDQRVMCPPAPAGTSTESRHTIQYRNHALNEYIVHSKRPLCRYDFTDEWNNLGYGRIGDDDSIWSIADPIVSPYSLADVCSADGSSIMTYAAMLDTAYQSYLWINRSVACIDSVEWYMVEKFFSSYRHTELPCIARLLDIPAHVDGIVSMRLDCDEDILSSRALFDVYNELQLPLSLAITTQLPMGEAEHRYMREVVAKNGAILSHSVTHAENWGGSYEDALDNAAQSQKTLTNIIRRKVRYAVSPFHMNPQYAVQALEKAGYDGFIAGSVGFDPEYLIARGGRVPFAQRIVSHSQQCMLHGCCIDPHAHDPLTVYKQACVNALRTHTFFAYLDHPFSQRYQYGWEDETQRIQMHRELIHFIREQGNIMFVNEDDCMDFMLAKSKSQIYYDDTQERPYPHVACHAQGTLRPAIEWKGIVYDD